MRILVTAPAQPVTVARVQAIDPTFAQTLATVSPYFDSLGDTVKQQHLWMARRHQVSVQSGTLVLPTDPALFYFVVDLWKKITGQTLTSIYGVATPQAVATGTAPPPQAEVLTWSCAPGYMPGGTPGSCVPLPSAAPPVPVPTTAQVVPAAAVPPPVVAPTVTQMQEAAAAAAEPSVVDRISEWFNGELISGVPNKYLALGVGVGVLFFMDSPAPARRGRR